VFCGNVTLDQAKELANKTFGDMPSKNLPAFNFPEPNPPDLPKVYVFDRKDAPQTVVSQILPAPERKNPDYYALSLADAVWGGGGFGTRLILNLREDKGYTYSARSRLDCGTSAGMWFAGGNMQGNKTKESIVEFIKELENLGGKKPISADELEDARTNRIRGYSQRFESLSSIGLRYAGLWALDLPLTEFQKELDEIKKLSIEAVNSTAAKYARKEKSVFLLIGDLKAIEPKLKELNIGEIVQIDAEGNPLKK